MSPSGPAQLSAAHRLSEALLVAASPEAVADALMAALQAALAAGEVHLTEVSQDGDVGEGTVAGKPDQQYRLWLGGPSLCASSGRWSRAPSRPATPC